MIVNLVLFSHLGFWNGHLFLVASFPDLCLLVPFSKEFILEEIELVLKHNSFYFDGSFYRQVNGTAMGIKFAPTCATLLMAYLEVKLYERINTDLGKNIQIILRNIGNDFWVIFLSHGHVHKQI